MNNPADDPNGVPPAASTTIPPGGQAPGGAIIAPPGSGTGDTPTFPGVPYDPQGIQLGDDGTAWLITKQYDPKANAGAGGYVWSQVALGNPNDPGFSWDHASANTGISVAIIRQQYQSALVQQQQQQAQSRAMGQWHYDSISPYTGAITVKNGANQTQTIPLDQVLAPDFATKFPGVDIADIQRNVQTVNQQNWLDMGFSAPGTSNYKAAKYYSLTPGIGQNLPPGSNPGDWTTTPPSRGGPVIPGANPNPTPDPGRGTGYDPTLGTPDQTPGAHGGAPAVATPPPAAPAPYVPPMRPGISLPAGSPTPNPMPVAPAAPPPANPVPTLPDQNPARR
jgi:hypothetical protein